MDASLLAVGSTMATRQPATRTLSTLEKLPAELRVIIYCFVFGPENKITVVFKKPQCLASSDGVIAITDFDCSLLAVCKLFRKEAAHLLFSKNVFHERTERTDRLPHPCHTSGTGWIITPYIRRLTITFTHRASLDIRCDRVIAAARSFRHLEEVTFQLDREDPSYKEPFHSECKNLDIVFLTAMLQWARADWNYDTGERSAAYTIFMEPHDAWTVIMKAVDVMEAKATDVMEAEAKDVMEAEATDVMVDEAVGVIEDVSHSTRVAVSDVKSYHKDILVLSGTLLGYGWLLCMFLVPPIMKYCRQ